MTTHKGMMFSTYDRDNDNWPGNCAAEHGGAFWHNKCYQCGVNMAVDFIWNGLTPGPELQSTRIWLACR